MGEPDAGRTLDARALQSASSENVIGRRIVVLDQTASTNDAVLKLAGEGAEEGLVVFAEDQTAGRGQRGHRWESAAGKGLWFSILLRPRLEPAQSVRLTSWLAQSVAGSIARELSLPATIKPPNDIHIEGRKIAGVLVEMRAQPGAPHIAIAGVGINVSQTAADFSPALRSTAISLVMAASRTVHRQNFAAAVLRELDRSYRAIFAP